MLRSLSVKVVLVHGAGYQILRLAKERRVKLTNSDGTGVTDEITLQVSVDAAIRLTNQIMEGLAVDLRAAYVNAIIAHPAGILGGMDHLFTGRVERVDVKALRLLLDEGIVPVIPPLGFDGEGRTYRVNPDAAAVEVGEELSAAKIIYLAPNSAFAGHPGLSRQLSVAETRELLKKQREEFSRSVVSKLECAAQACVQGVPRVHLLDGGVNEAADRDFQLRRLWHDGLFEPIPADPAHLQEGCPRCDVADPATRSEELARRTGAGYSSGWRTIGFSKSTARPSRAWPCMFILKMPRASSPASMSARRMRTRGMAATSWPSRRISRARRA